uniref:Uncharacterized protein n=1 Tax=Ciona intestinalis TaxID=7719 RepID=H2XMA5_CIOIN
MGDTALLHTHALVLLGGLVKDAKHHSAQRAARMVDSVCLQNNANVPMDILVKIVVKRDLTLVSIGRNDTFCALWI